MRRELASKTRKPGPGPKGLALPYRFLPAKFIVPGNAARELASKTSTPGPGPKGLALPYRFLLAIFIATTAHAQDDGIAAPLKGTQPGDPLRGRTLVANRQQGLCLLCHSAPIPEEQFQGNLAPSLAGAGERWSIPQLRQRIVDSSRVQPSTIMPSYYKTTGLTRVAPAQRDKTIFTAQQVEDVVAYLATLKAKP